MSVISGILGLGFFLSEMGLARRRRASSADGTVEADRGSLQLLWRVILGAIAVGAVLSIYGIGPRLLHPAWQALSLVLFAAGTVLRWWAIRHLGKFFTVDVALASNHRVVDSGPYHWVRHPSYTGLMMQFGGLALAMGNLLSLCVIVVPIWLALRHRIGVEEGALSAALGESYTLYARKRKRLLPLVY